VANPSTLSVGSRILWTAPYSPPILPSSAPTTVPSANASGVAPIPANVAGQPPGAFYPGMTGGGPFPGLVQTAAGSSPDFIGSTAIIHDARGQPFLVNLGLNATTWASSGSPTAREHWQFIDLTA
jgi:hypothetical protein